MSGGGWITLPDLRVDPDRKPYPANYPYLPEGVPSSHPIYQLLGALSGFAGRTGLKSEGRFLCPVHADTNPSLDVLLGGESQPVVMKCWGCGATGSAVCEAIGVPQTVLCDPLDFDPDEVDWRFSFASTLGGSGSRGAKKKWRDLPRVVATYEYRLEDGTPYLRIHRKEGTLADGTIAKDFSGAAEHWAGPLGWLRGEDGKPLIPYNLDRFPEWKEAGKKLYVVEGEKDVDRLTSLGVAATTFPHGASLLAGEVSRRKRSKPPRIEAETWKYFSGFSQVVVVADRDTKGVEHARLMEAVIKNAVEPDGRVFSLVPPATLGRKADISDLLDAGMTSKALVRLTRAVIDEIKNEELNGSEKEEAASEPTVESGGNSPGRHLVAVPLSKVVPKPVDWLWEGLIPLGELTLLAGRQGIGKSTLGYQLAADITRGTLDGSLRGTLRNVLIVATEDSFEHTIVPRLEAAGADLDRVFGIEVHVNERVTGALDLARDLPDLSDLVREYNAALVLIDPLMSRLGGKVDTHKDSEVREVLEPLVALAHDCNCGVLALIHVNKSGSSDPVNLVMGSVAFTAVARSVLFASVDPDDSNRRLIGQVKSNLGPMRKGSMTFSIESANVSIGGSAPVTTSRLRWGAGDARSIPDLIAFERKKATGKTVAERSGEWIACLLSSRPARTASRKDVILEAEGVWTEDQINKGCGWLKEHGRLDVRRDSTPGGPATWTLRAPERATNEERSMFEADSGPAY